MMLRAVPIVLPGVGMQVAEGFVTRSRVFRIHSAGSICVLDHKVARGVDD